MPMTNSDADRPQGHRSSRRPAGVRLAICAALASAVLVLAAACAVPHPQQVVAGQSETEMLAVMGPPTGRYPMADGTQRVEFARGPAGRVTWMVDLDAAGRVLSIDQVLTAANFARVEDGMSRDALLRLLGRPAERHGEWQQRETWSWRYETNDCLWFRVTLDADGRVQGGGAYMFDPACDAGPGFRN